MHGALNQHPYIICGALNQHPYIICGALNQHSYIICGALNQHPFLNCSALNQHPFLNGSALNQHPYLNCSAFNQHPYPYPKSTHNIYSYTMGKREIQYTVLTIYELKDAFITYSTRMPTFSNHELIDAFIIYLGCCISTIYPDTHINAIIFFV